jgi:hypothetical protein
MFITKRGSTRDKIIVKGLVLLPLQGKGAGVTSLARKMDWCYFPCKVMRLVLLPLQVKWAGVTSLVS